MWNCETCNKPVAPDINMEPKSKYWQYPAVFCGALCSLTWYEEEKDDI